MPRSMRFWTDLLCAYCAIFSSLSLAVCIQCMSCGAICKVTSRARDEGRIFRAGGRVPAFRLGVNRYPPYASRGRAGVCRLLQPVAARFTCLVATGRHTPRNPQTRSSRPMAGVVAGGSPCGSILQSPVAWCKMFLVTESKTHRITRHLGLK